MVNNSVLKSRPGWKRISAERRPAGPAVDLPAPESEIPKTAEELASGIFGQKKYTVAFDCGGVNISDPTAPNDPAALHIKLGKKLVRIKISDLLKQLG